MSDYFLLDPDYKDFDFPDKHKLKFLTVYGEQHTFIFMAVLALIFGLELISSSVRWIPVDWAYLTTGRHTEGKVTVSCQASDEQYFYSFITVDANGQTHQYTGSGKSAKDKSCPKLNALIPIEYLPDQPEASARDRQSPLSNLGSWALIILFSLGAIKIGFDAIWAFLKAIPRFIHLRNVITLLEGQIISVKDLGFTFQMRARNGYYVKVEYEFTVDNRKFRNIQVHRRNDLRGKSLPPPGTPVRILYADENTYVML